MVAITNRDQVGWLSPAPIWRQLGNLDQPVMQNRFLRPSILRFASDEFMDELGALLAYHPESMDQWEARYETWEEPMPKPVPVTEVALPSLTEPVSMQSTRITRALIKRVGGLRTQDMDDEDEPRRKLKLYQPIQQRYYLVAASLVCRRIGFPDRRFDPGRQERVSFVIRRIILPKEPGGQTEPDDDPANWDEYAYVKGDSGHRWQQIKHTTSDSADLYVDGEERVGLFSLGFTESTGQPRRMLCGVIPVGRREDYLATPKVPVSNQASTTPSDASIDSRLFLLQMQVTGTWRNLVDQNLEQMENFYKKTPLVEALQEALDEPPNKLDEGIIKRTREQAQTISWYILLDLERFLHDHLTPVWDFLVETPDTAPLVGAQKELYEWLASVTPDAGLEKELLQPPGAGYTVSPTLWEALKSVSKHRTNLEEVESQFALGEARDSENNALWPDFFFPLADIGDSGPLPLSISNDPFPRLPLDLDNSNNRFDVALEDLNNRFDDALKDLTDLVAKALPSEPAAKMPELSLPDPEAIDADNAWFTIRCVFERPNCGPRAPAVVSAPSEPFEMASFFDPYAPARPVQIGMPLDISPAGLRKFKKSTTLAISDMFCARIKRIRKLTLADLVLSVLPWPFHKDLPPVGPTKSCTQDDKPNGMYCSLSIPIVTLCALILLIVMVLLFNYFFYWLPFLFLCLPIPGLAGKKLKGKKS
jgi:hypothetical protein